MDKLKALLASFDAYQQKTPWLAFPIGVVKKFGDDTAGYLASLVAYYGFFSLFPLLLVFVTVLGFVLGSGASQKVLATATQPVRIFGITDVHALRGSGLGLAIGIVLTLLAGIGVIKALQYGMDEIWAVPFTKRPNFLISRLRAVIMLAIFGVAILIATGLSGLASAGASLSPVFKILGPLGSAGVNFLVLALAFRVLTVAELSWRDVVPGAVVAAILLTALQLGGSLYAAHVLKSANKTYGTFATVIAMLSFIYLGAQLTFYAAEINVVKTKHLWPRSLGTTPTEADERALASKAKEQRRRPEETVGVGFQEPPRSPGGRQR